MGLVSSSATKISTSQIIRRISGSTFVFASLATAAALLSLQMRVQLPLGMPLSTADLAHPLLLGSISVLAVLLVSVILRPILRLAAFVSDARPFRQFIVCILLTALLMLPIVGWLQAAYCLGIGILIGVLAVAIPFRIYIGQPGISIQQDILHLWQRRELLMIWLKFNIETRYSQRILGIVWIVLLPMSTAVVLTIAFTQIMRVQLDRPFIAFYLSALVIYNVFNNGVLSSNFAVLSKLNLITQVYFPREILVLIVLGEVLVDFVFTFVTMLIVNAFFDVLPNVYFIYLLPLLLIMVIITLGLMLMLSALSILIRDVPQLVSVAIQVIFFLSPIVYPVEQIPERFRILYLINPIAPLIQGFRDVIVYTRAPDSTSLYYSFAFAIVMFCLGYATFKATESEMADLL
jgi:ABC-type polysaccharide/polyol phosphate export permease